MFVIYSETATYIVVIYSETVTNCKLYFCHSFRKCNQCLSFRCEMEEAAGLCREAAARKTRLYGSRGAKIRYKHNGTVKTRKIFTA